MPSNLNGFGISTCCEPYSKGMAGTSSLLLVAVGSAAIVTGRPRKRTPPRSAEVALRQVPEIARIEGPRAFQRRIERLIRDHAEVELGGDAPPESRDLGRVLGGLAARPVVVEIHERRRRCAEQHKTPRMLQELRA